MRWESWTELTWCTQVKIFICSLNEFSYFILEHDASSPCLEICPKIPLTQYLQQEGVSVTPDMGTYVSSVDQLINSYIAHVLKSPSSGLLTEDYHFNISYDTKGQVIMEGLIWPVCFRDHNLIQYDQGLSDEQIDEIKSETLTILRKQISSSSKVSDIKSQFNMSQTEATKMATLVQVHQIHICKEENCTRCQNAPLPSLQCMFKKFPESLENIATSKRFLRAMKSKLMSLSIEDLSSKSTDEWLEEVWGEVEISEPVEDNMWRLKLDMEDFYFKFDDSFEKLLQIYEDEPFAALYQYCLGLGELHQTEELIMKRLNLLDCFTDPYVPFFLQAAKSPIKVIALTNSNDNEIWSLDYPDYLGCYEAGMHSHVKVPLAEVYSLIDNKKLKTRSSRPSEFVFTGSTSSLLLKKVKQPNENCFHFERDRSFYEIQETAVTRYCNRLNGRNLLLSEVACHYDFCGQEESEKKYEVFHDRLNKIPMTEIESVSGVENLPELILCQNKDVLEIRKRSKVLMFQSYDPETYDHKFSQVLLYTVVDRYEDLTQDNVQEIFDKVDEETGEQIVKRNKR